jgi:3-keto-5-aminohexanoate cleavage enzyme
VQLLPAGATFAATGVGRTTLPVMLAALSAGGHLRVGMEDTLTYAPGQPVRDNAQLVARAAAAATLAQRPPMPVPQARALLGIPDRRPPGRLAPDRSAVPASAAGAGRQTDAHA